MQSRKRALFLIAVALVLALLPDRCKADTPPATYTIITSTTATTIKAGPGIFYGAFSTAIQTTVTTCYDNTAASGVIIWNGTLTPTAPSTGIPSSGVQFLTGLTCVIATSVVAPGYGILWK